MTWLPWLLLAVTLSVRVLLARRNRAGFWLDLCSVPAWLTYYGLNRDYQLLAIPLIFGWLDVQALRRWWA